jgi:hypothetical protein
MATTIEIYRLEFQEDTAAIDRAQGKIYEFANTYQAMKTKVAVAAPLGIWDFGDGKTAKVIDSAAGTTKAIKDVGEAAAKAGEQARGGGRGVLQLAQFMDDAKQFSFGLDQGMRAVGNNIPGLLMGFGASAGLAGTVALVGTVAAVTIPKLLAFADSIDPSMFEKSGAAIDKLTHRIETLKNYTYLTAVEMHELHQAQEALAASHAADERAKTPTASQSGSAAGARASLQGIGTSQAHVEGIVEGFVKDAVLSAFERAMRARAHDPNETKITTQPKATAAIKAFENAPVGKGGLQDQVNRLLKQVYEGDATAIKRLEEFLKATGRFEIDKEGTVKSGGRTIDSLSKLLKADPARREAKQFEDEELDRLSEEAQKREDDAKKVSAKVLPQLAERMLGGMSEDKVKTYLEGELKRAFPRIDFGDKDVEAILRHAKDSLHEQMDTLRASEGMNDDEAKAKIIKELQLRRDAERVRKLLKRTTQALEDGQAEGFKRAYAEDLANGVSPEQAEQKLKLRVEAAIRSTFPKLESFPAHFRELVKDFTDKVREGFDRSVAHLMDAEKLTRDQAMRRVRQLEAAQQQSARERLVADEFGQAAGAVNAGVRRLFPNVSKLTPQQRAQAGQAMQQDLAGAGLSPENQGKVAQVFNNPKQIRQAPAILNELMHAGLDAKQALENLPRVFEIMKNDHVSVYGALNHLNYQLIRNQQQQANLLARTRNETLQALNAANQVGNFLREVGRSNMPRGN